MLCSQAYECSTESELLVLKQVTSQMIVQCKAHIMEGGKLWDQDQPKLVGKLRAALKLGDAYQKQYRAAWEGPGSQAVSFDTLRMP